MDNEIKETLLKVADYNELERQKATKAGSFSFIIMFMVCAVVIVIQMIMTGNLSLVIGETVIFLTGGIGYLYFLVKCGTWNGGHIKSTPGRDLVVSVICTGIFTVLFCVILWNRADLQEVLCAAVCFFATFSLVSYVLLRVLSGISGKRSEKR